MSDRRKIVEPTHDDKAQPLLYPEPSKYFTTKPLRDVRTLKTAQLATTPRQNSGGRASRNWTVNIAMSNMEREEGGRAVVLDKLKEIPELDPAETQLIAILSNPARRRTPIGQACAEAHISINAFVRMLAKADGARALRLARQRAYEKLPEVAGDVVERALPKKRICRECFGRSWLVADKKFRTDYPAEVNEQGLRICDKCEKGYVELVPDIERQKLALQLLPGLLQSEKGSSVTVNNQNNVGVSMPRATVAFWDATDQILRERRKAIDVVATSVTTTEEK